ncbi:MAG: 2-oxo acid dehydrogenase subunit E2, partial [Deltaproteobacteria bacterium]|nr:2-oxo acid dehydrogenase subunit E2 [Deltaproteobacteria bacterium]
MTVEIIVPKLGMTQKEITVVQWLKADGEAASEGQVVVVIETAKVSYEVPAPAAGSVFSLKKVKDKVKIGDVLGVVAESSREFEEYQAGQAQAPARTGAGTGEDDFFGSAAPEGQGVRLSFEGQEPVAAQAAAPAPTAALPTVEVGDRPVRERIPFIGMRRTIADNMMASLMSGAQLTIVTEVDMTELASFRQELKLDRPEAKVTFVDMLIKLLPGVLKEFPVLNSAVVGDEVICWGDYHIAFAVALDEGLIVPV